MNRVPILAIVLSLLISFFPARIFAQVFYQYPGAPVIDAGQFVAGPYLAAGEHKLMRLGGFGRMNATKYLDVGFELLFDSADGDGRYGLGGDVKFNLFPPTSSIPFDLSVTGGLGAITSDDIRVIQVPIGGIISSPFKLENGNILVPYLGVYLLIVDTKWARGTALEGSDTDLDVELRAGLMYTFSAGPDLFAAVHLGRVDLVMVGVSFWLKGRDQP